MISSIINNLKNYKAIGGKCSTNIVAKNIEYTRSQLKLLPNVKAHFHCLLTKKNFHNLNININNRIFANAQIQDNLLRVNKCNYTFKNNAKLNENSTIAVKLIYFCFFGFENIF